jgi:type I restriction enzyme, S subunit
MSAIHQSNPYGFQPPQGWRESTLGDVIDTDDSFIQTGPFGTQLHAHDYKIEGVPVVMPQQLGDNRIELDGIARISEEDRDRLARHVMEEGDIVFSRRGDVTRRALITSQEAGYLCGTGCLLIRLKHPEIDNRFLSLFFSLRQFKNYIIQKAVGATMPNLNTGILERIPLVLPTIAEQLRIVEVLSAYDDLIEINRRRMGLLEESVRLLYQEWFVRLHFPGHKHTPITNGQPEAWQKISLGSITSKIGSGSTPRGGEASYLSEGIALIRSLNVYDDRFEDAGLAFIGEDQAAALEGVTVQSRDILLNITGASVARCCMAPERFLPARVNQHVMIIRTDSSKADAFIVHASINSDERKRQLLSYAQKGSTREALTKEMVSAFEITLPSDVLMRQFGEIAKTCFVQRENLALQNQKLRAARDLLLPRLMSGALSV